MYVTIIFKYMKMVNHCYIIKLNNNNNKKMLLLIIMDYYYNLIL